MQQPEEAAAEPEAERRRGFRFEEERRIVEPQLLERVAQLGVLAAFHRIEAGEDHRLADLEAGERLGRRAGRLGDGVADLRVADRLDAGEDESDFADAERIDRDRLRARTRRPDRLRTPVPCAIRRIFMPGADDAVEHARQDDHAAVGVVPRVEDQRLERRLRLALRRGQPLHDRFEDLVDAGAFLGAREDRAAGVEADDLLDLPLGLVRLRARQVDLVDDRDDLEAVVHREVGVGEGLRFDALRGVDEQQRPFAGGQRARDFVREVDVPGRVDQVQDVDPRRRRPCRSGGRRGP